MDNTYSVTPKRLKAGDKIGLVTLSAPEASENPGRVEMGIERLKELGFSVELGRYALSADKGYLAAAPELLAQDLNDMFKDSSIAGVICTGGGTNANRLLPYIDYAAIRQNPKALVGVSNPTVVLNAITARTGLVSFHGPVLVWNFGGDTFPAYTMDAFEKAVMTTGVIGDLPRSGNWSFLKDGKAAGVLYGGNLWSLQSLLGTPFEPEWEGALLFWEDIAKEPKRVDAMLTHLKLAGVLDKISGMVVGELVLCDPQGPSLSIDEIILELTAEYKFPVLTGVRLGHTDDKLTLPIGARASIDSETGSFRVDQSAVR